MPVWPRPERLAEFGTPLAPLGQHFRSFPNFRHTSADVGFRADLVRFSPSFGHRSEVALTVTFDPTRKSMTIDTSLVAGTLLMGLIFDSGGPNEECRLMWPVFGNDPL